MYAPSVISILAEEARTYGVKLSSAQLEQFERYLALLGAWAERANLVGNASQEVVRRRHFLESIALGAALREREVLRPGTSVLDVGAGAGFPGTVLNIVWPGLRLTLLEATAKKTAFLGALIDALSLEDVQVVNGRAEELAHDPSLRGQFDLVVARAVAPLATLLELTLPFARTRGRVVTPKGSRAAAEVAGAQHAAQELGGKIFVVPFRVPGPTQQLVVTVKLRETPAQYPRRAGVPKRHPL